MPQLSVLRKFSEFSQWITACVPSAISSAALAARSSLTDGLSGWWAPVSANLFLHSSSIAGVSIRARCLAHHDLWAEAPTMIQQGVERGACALIHLLASMLSISWQSVAC